MVSARSSSARQWRALRVPGLCVLGAWLLAACTTPVQAPVVEMSQTQPGVETAATAPAATYVVRAGDTLYSIARAHSVTWQDIAMWNNITDPSQLRVGQTLRVSEGGVAEPMAPATPGVVAQAEPIAPGGVQQRPLDGVEPAQQPITPSPAVNNTSGIDWMWPASGKILAPFNQALNKGVDIEGNEGDPVVAAADGVVVYAGSGLRGYGNLLIVRHNASYLSAYAHNRRLLVQEGENVRRGQQIAELGQSDAPSPRLHFEIRRGGTPEDPLQFLPQR